MVLLFRLPFLLIELLLRRLFPREREEERDATRPAEGGFAGARGGATSGPAPAFTGDEPGAGAGGPPPPTAAEAIERRFAREQAAAAPSPTPPTPPTPAAPPPADAPSALRDAGHVDREVEVVESFGPADDVRGTISVDEPWDGYARQPASAIVARLRDADAATKAVVALFERGHKNRATVLRAAR